MSTERAVREGLMQAARQGDLLAFEALCDLCEEEGEVNYARNVRDAVAGLLGVLKACAEYQVVILDRRGRIVVLEGTSRWRTPEKVVPAFPGALVDVLREINWIWQGVCLSQGRDKITVVEGSGFAGKSTKEVWNLENGDFTPQRADSLYLHKKVEKRKKTKKAETEAGQ